MKKTLALILLMALASLPVMGNIFFREGGSVWLSDGGYLHLRGVEIQPEPANGDVTATMTSAIAPSPNKVYDIGGAGYFSQPWLSFDHVTSGTNYLRADRQNVEWCFDFGASFPHAIQKARFIGYTANSNPKSFKILASNGAATTTLYIGTGTTDLGWQTFAWTNTTPYRYISMQVSTTQTGASLYVYEVEYWETN